MSTRSRQALRPVVVDLAIAAAVCAGALSFEVFDAGDVGASLDAVDVVTCLGAAALILLRRRAPLPVLAVAVIAAVWSLIPDDHHEALGVAAIVALYTVASTSGRRTAWTAGAVTAALYLAEFVAPTTKWMHIDTYGWNGRAQPGRPEGGEALAFRALFAFIADWANSANGGPKILAKKPAPRVTPRRPVHSQTLARLRRR